MDLHNSLSLSSTKLNLVIPDWIGFWLSTKGEPSHVALRIIKNELIRSSRRKADPIIVEQIQKTLPLAWKRAEFLGVDEKGRKISKGIAESSATLYILCEVLKITPVFASKTLGIKHDKAYYNLKRARHLMDNVPSYKWAVRWTSHKLFGSPDPGFTE